MSTKSRAPVVVGAILIQLCLGAIYAWSVFTPSLVLPLEDTAFEDRYTVGSDHEVILEGDFIDKPMVYEDTGLELSFEGPQAGNITSVVVVLELRDDNNEALEDFVEKGKTKYELSDQAGKYTFSLDNGSYDNATGKFTVDEVDIPVPGNWHILVTGRDASNTTVVDADILINDGITGRFGFSSAQTQAVFSAGLATFAVFTVIAGRLMPRIGPRKTALIGGVLLGVGYILGGLLGTTFISQLVLIGIIGGMGIGIGYVVPIAVGIKWYPDHKGLISGLGVAGFGFGATLWVQLAAAKKTFMPAANLLANMGVLNLIALYGVLFMVLICIGAITMVNPPEGYRPKGWKPPKQTDKDASSAGAMEFESGAMLRTPQFWAVWLIFCFGALAGLMVIGNIALFGKQALSSGDYTAAEAAAIAATAMSIYAITNGIGRIVWGLISDKMGRRNAIATMSAFQGVMMLVFFSAGSNPVLFTIVAAIIGFNFGGNFALFPSITADYFGNKNVGKNYGFTFTSYGVGGIAGPILGGVAAASVMGYTMAFYPAAVLCLAGAAIAFMLKPPRPPAGQEPPDLDGGEGAGGARAKKGGAGTDRKTGGGKGKGGAKKGKGGGRKGKGDGGKGRGGKKGPDGKTLDAPSRDEEDWDEKEEEKEEGEEEADWDEDEEDWDDE